MARPGGEGAGISCGHCVKTIEMEVSDIVGVDSVKADASTKKVQVEWKSPTTSSEIVSVLNEIGFPPES